MGKRLPPQVLVICNLLRKKHKVTGGGKSPTRTINGKTFQAKHVEWAKQVLYIARCHRRKLLEAADKEAQANKDVADGQGIADSERIS